MYLRIHSLFVQFRDQAVNNVSEVSASAGSVALLVTSQADDGNITSTPSAAPQTPLEAALAAERAALQTGELFTMQTKEESVTSECLAAQGLALHYEPLPHACSDRPAGFHVATCSARNVSCNKHNLP